MQRGFEPDLAQTDEKTLRTYTHRQRKQRDGASAGSIRASHETQAPSRVYKKIAKRERENTLSEPGRHSCRAEAS